MGTVWPTVLNRRWGHHFGVDLLENKTEKSVGKVIAGDLKPSADSCEVWEYTESKSDKRVMNKTGLNWVYSHRAQYTSYWCDPNLRKADTYRTIGERE